MKISQVDYTSIMNANSARMAAESESLNNKSIAMTNAINSTNRTNMQRKTELQDQMMEVQASANKANAIANVINSGLNLVAEGANIYNSIREAKIKNDTAAYNLQNLSDIADFKTYIATADDLGSFDENGQFHVSEGVTSFIDSKITSIQNSSWDQSVKDMAILQWTELGSAATVDIAQEYIVRNKEAEAGYTEAYLGELMDIDILAGDREGTTGVSYIESLSDKTPAEKKYLSYAYQTDVKSGIAKNELYAIMDTSGYNAAMEHLNDSTEFSEIEKSTLRNSLTAQNANNIEQAKIMAGNYSAEMLKSMTPAEMRASVASLLNTESQDEDYQNAVKTAIDQVQIQWAADKYKGYSNTSTMTPSQMDKLYNDISSDGTTFFGIEDTQSAMLSVIDEGRTAYTVALEESEEKQIEAWETSFSTYADGTVAAFQAGNLSSKNAIQGIRDYSAVMDKNFRQTFGELQEDGTYAIAADSPYYPKYVEFQLRQYKAEQSKLKSCVLANVPTQYEGLVDTMISSSLAITHGKEYTKLNSEQKVKWKSSETSMIQELTDWFAANAEKDLNQSAVENKCKEVIQKHSVEVAAIITDIALDKKTLVNEGLGGGVNVENFTKVYNEMIDSPEFVRFDSDGVFIGFGGSDPAAVENVYHKMEQQLANSIVDYGIVTSVEDLTGQGVIFDKRLNEAGEAVAIPQIQIGDTAYSFDRNMNLVSKQADGSWAIVVPNTEGLDKYEEDAVKAGMPVSEVVNSRTDEGKDAEKAEAAKAMQESPVFTYALNLVNSSEDMSWTEAAEKSAVAVEKGLIPGAEMEDVNKFINAAHVIDTPKEATANEKEENPAAGTHKKEEVPDENTHVAWKGAAASSQAEKARASMGLNDDQARNEEAKAKKKSTAKIADEIPVRDIPSEEEIKTIAVEAGLPEKEAEKAVEEKPVFNSVAEAEEVLESTETGSYAIEYSRQNDASLGEGLRQAAKVVGNKKVDADIDDIRKAIAAADYIADHKDEADTKTETEAEPAPKETPTPVEPKADKTTVKPKTEEAKESEKITFTASEQKILTTPLAEQWANSYYGKSVKDMTDKEKKKLLEHFRGAISR